MKDSFIKKFVQVSSFKNFFFFFFKNHLGCFSKLQRTTKKKKKKEKKISPELLLLVLILLHMIPFAEDSSFQIKINHAIAENDMKFRKFYCLETLHFR